MRTTYIPLIILLLFFIFAFTSNCSDGKSTHQHQITTASMELPMNKASEAVTDTNETYEIQKTAEEWKQILTSKEYRILREKGTELPFVNEYWNNKEEGFYYCRACGQKLYSSATKYRSGTGWPSFWEPVADSVVGEREDNSFWMNRTEIVCSRCGSHIGHVFDDGPEPTGLRYCMNSAALDFRSEDVDGDGKITSEQ